MSDPTTAQLVAWIDSHYPAEPTIDNGDGTLRVAVTCVDKDHRVFIERSDIPATLSAARDWLEY